MDELTPIYRIEHFLDAIVNNSVNPYLPEYRVEYYLAKIAGENVAIPEPIYRKEFYLAYLCGEEVELPDPIYRIEYYLAFLCGLNVELPEPIYRVEFWLWDWCGGGGIEKTITGNPIHITDALAKPAQSLSVKLEPIQDLHGYGNPWPSGGGKNKFPITLATQTKNETTFTVSSDGAITISGTPTAQTRVALNSLAITPDAYMAFSTIGIITGVRVFVRANNEGTITYPTISPSATLSPGVTYDQFYLEVNTTFPGTATTAKFQLESGSTSTDWTPYSNICPISGHTDADVTRTGKNLFNPTPSRDSASGLTFTVKSGKLTVSGTNATTAYTSGGITKDNCRYSLKSGTYTLSMPASATNTAGSYLNFEMFDADGNRTQKVIYGHTKTPQTFTINSDVVFDWWCAIPAGTYPDAVFEIQLKVGSSASEWGVYTGQTYPIPLGTTVYGGTLDVLTGVLTVTWAGVDMGTLPWQPRESLGGFSATVTPTPKNQFVAISSCYPYKGAYSDVTDKAFGYVYYNQVFVKDSAYSDAGTLKTALNGQTLVYELATPTTIQLTPTQVELLQGENNLFSDGEMTLVYLADGNASDVEALNILLGGRYVNNHTEDEPSDREALDILLGRTK